MINIRSTEKLYNKNSQGEFLNLEKIGTIYLRG